VEYTHLYYIAADHANVASSPTFILVSRVFENLPIDAVVIEGLQRSYGFSPECILQSFKSQRHGDFYRWGEPSFAAILASERSIPFTGAEPDDKSVCQQLLAKGYSREDVIGFYFLRQIPQYRRDHTIADKGFRRAFTDFVSTIKPALGLDDQSFDYSQFLHWCRVRNGTNFIPENLEIDDVAPLSEGKLFTQRISAAVGQIRVLVIYGASHLATQRRVLQSLLGEPVRQSRDF
jgi:hypothetical protein